MFARVRSRVAFAVCLGLVFTFLVFVFLELAGQIETGKGAAARYLARDLNSRATLWLIFWACISAILYLLNLFIDPYRRMKPLQKLAPLVPKTIKNIYFAFEFVVANSWSSIAGALIIIALIEQFSELTDEAIADWLTGARGFIDEHITPVSIFLAVFVSFLVHSVSRLGDHFNLGSNARNAGLVMTSRNDTPWELKRTDTFLNTIAGESRNLKIICANGYSTFSKEDSPLHGLIRRCTGKVQILLSEPDSDGVRQRVRDLRQANVEITESEYTNKVRSSLRLLRDINDDKNNIEVRMYRGYPFQKQIITDKYVYVQQYPDNAPVKNSPAFGYLKGSNREKRAIYDNTCAHFDRFWDGRRVGHYDFDTETVSFVKSVVVDPADPSNKKKWRRMVTKKHVHSGSETITLEPWT